MIHLHIERSMLLRLVVNMIHISEPTMTNDTSELTMLLFSRVLYSAYCSHSFPHNLSHGVYKFSNYVVVDMYRFSLF